MKVEEQSEGYREIPGLPEPERTGKKGKKKNQSKKSLTLSNFSEANGKSSVSLAGMPSDVSEPKPPRPQLTEKESAILESCHSYIHDYLKMSGPMNAFDARLQAEINQFPPEAKALIQKVGGLKAYILLCQDLLVVDKIVGAKVHAAKIKELAIRDVYNNIPGREGEKQIWNTSTNFNNKVSDPGPPQTVESAIQYHSTTQLGHIGDRGLTGQPKPPPDSSSAQVNSETIETYKKEIIRLSGQNQQFLLQLSEKDKKIGELCQQEGRLTQLELENTHAKKQIKAYREEIERLKAELAEAKSGGDNKLSLVDNNNRDLILSLQKQLEAEKLRNLNLSQGQVDGGQLAGLSLGGGQPTHSLNRQNSFVNLSSTLGDDKFGLRNITFNSGLDLKSPTNLFGAIGSDVRRPMKDTGSNSFGAPGGSLGPAGGSLGAPGGSLGAPRGSLGAPGGNLAPSNNPVSSLGAPISSLGGSLGAPGSSLGAPGSSLGAPGSSLGAPGSSLGAGGSFNLMKSASASTIGLSASRGESPIGSNFPGFMQLPTFTPGQPMMTSGSSQSLLGGGQSLLSSLVPSVAGVSQTNTSSISTPQQSSYLPSQGWNTAVSSQTSFGLSHLAAPNQSTTSTNDVTQQAGGDLPKSNSAIRQEQLIKKLVATIPGSNDESIKHYIQVLRDRNGKLSGWSTNKITQEILHLMHQN